MAIYEVTGEDGKVYEVEGEDAGQGTTAPTTAAPEQPSRLREAVGNVASRMGDMLTGPIRNATSGAADLSTKGLIDAALSPVPGSLSTTLGRAAQVPSELIRKKLEAEGHPTLGFLAGMATDPTTYAGMEGGAGALKAGVKGAAEVVAGATESAYPKLAGKMMEIFRNPKTMLPGALGGPKSMAEVKQMLNEAEKAVLQKLKATSLKEIDDSAKALTRAKSGLSDDVIATVDRVRQNQVIAQNPSLAGKVVPTKVPIEDLISAEKSLQSRISHLYDLGLGDHAKAMQMELERVSKLVDEALPQLKDARQAFHFTKLREEVTQGGVMNMPVAGVSIKRLLTTPGLVSYGMAGMGAAMPAAGGAGRVAGAATATAMDRLRRRYLPRK